MSRPRETKHPEWAAVVIDDCGSGRYGYIHKEAWFQMTPSEREYALREVKRKLVAR